MKSPAVMLLFLIISLAAGASFNNRIIGGQIAKDGQFPYEISLRIYGNHACGGTIISEKYVLTAAHCVKGVPKEMLTVVAGTNKLNSGGDIYQLDHYHYHENFSLAGTKFDVAIIKVTSNIKFNSKVQPIQLNTNPIPSGSSLILSGWGLEEYPGSSLPNDLKYLEVKALTTQECRERLKENGFPEDTIDGSLLCAFKQNGEGACSGDSGSPLVFEGRVAGMASWVIPCGIGYPDVYTRVSEYIDWLQEHMD